MNETDLSRLALFTACFGFLALGYVVLYIPVDVEDNSLEYKDGEILRISQSESGHIVTVKDLSTSTYIVKSDRDISVGEQYRFYDPQSISPTSDLETVEHLRQLTQP